MPLKPFEEVEKQLLKRRVKPKLKRFWKIPK
jgi:hypothetical protein